jgi:TolB protein
MVVPISGGEPRELNPTAMLPRWSPNGARIAFAARVARGVEGTSNIVSIPAGGGEVVPVTNDAFLNWNPVWAPDGASLLFVSNRGGSPNIWRVAIDQQTGQARGEPQPVTTPAANIAHLSISADGRRLAYSAVQESQNIEMLRFDPVKGEVLGQPQPVTTGSRFWANPDPSPDGTQVVFYSQISPEGDLYISPTDGTGALRQLTEGPALDRVPRWSPDGEWIAMFSDRSNQLQVWMIRADGSELRQVTKESSSIIAWSPDGRRMVASRVGPAQRGQAPVIIDPRGDADGGSKQELKLPAGQKFAPNAWSPDGKWIAGAPTFSTSGILLYSLADLHIEQLTDFGEWPVWLPDSRRLLLVSRGREYYLLDSRTKAASKIWSTVRDTLGPPRLTRDGRMIVFQRRVTESDIWVASLH